MKSYMIFVRHKLVRKVFLVVAESEELACAKLHEHLGGNEAGRFVSEGIYEAPEGGEPISAAKVAEAQ